MECRALARPWLENGEQKGYQAACECGWTGAVMLFTVYSFAEARTTAMVDANIHVTRREREQAQASVSHR
jgi:hypothetical protein